MPREAALCLGRKRVPSGYPRLNSLSTATAKLAGPSLPGQRLGMESLLLTLTSCPHRHLASQGSPPSPCLRATVLFSSYPTRLRDAR